MTLKVTIPPKTSFGTELAATDFKAGGMTGAQAASRYVGGTASGAPTSGTFAVGDFVVDQTGKAWVCTAAGTPGTWAQLAGGGTSTLAADTDVAIGSPTDGQALIYSGSLGKWQNRASSGYATAVFAATRPTADASAQTGTYEIGDRFYCEVACTCTGIMFLRNSADTLTTRNAHLWDNSGNLVATASTSNESGGGWVTASFATPVPLPANTYYAATVGYQSNRYDGSGLLPFAAGPLVLQNDAFNSTLGAAPTNLPGPNYRWVTPVISVPFAAPTMPAPSVRVHNSGTISLANTTVQTLTFDTTDLDQGTSAPQHSTTTNTSRLTCQQAGTYVVEGCVRLAGTASGQAEAQILKNGNPVTNSIVPASSTGTRALVPTAIIPLGVGDYVEFAVYQNSGGALNAEFWSGYSPTFSMARIDSGPGAVQANTKVQLNSVASSDVASAVAISADTWTNLGPLSSFTVDDSNSVVEVLPRIGAFIRATAQPGGSGSRILVDGVTSYMVGAASDSVLYADSTTQFTSFPFTGALPVAITGLAAGSHTLQVQVVMRGAAGTLYCRPASLPETEFFSLQVLERKQSSSPAGSMPAPAVRVTNSVVESIANSLWTTVVFDTTSFDQGTSMPQHSTSSNASRLACQQAGVYQVDATAIFASNSTGLRGVQFLKNGVQAGAYVLLQPVSVANETGVMVSDKFSLVVGDYVEMQVIQSSGVALNLDQVFLSMARVDTGMSVGTTAKIAEVQCSSAQATISFSSIPQTYRTLKIVAQMRGDTAATVTGLSMRFNGDAGSNYAAQVQFVQAGVPGNFQESAVTAVGLDNIDAASATSGMATPVEVLIPNYAGTTFWKEGFWRQFHSGDAGTYLRGGFSWHSTAAVTSIVLFAAAGNFAAGSIASLYGEA